MVYKGEYSIVILYIYEYQGLNTFWWAPAITESLLANPVGVLPVVHIADGVMTKLSIIGSLRKTVLFIIT